MSDSVENKPASPIRFWWARRAAWLLVLISVAVLLYVFVLKNPEWSVPTNEPVGRVVLAVLANMFFSVVPAIILALIVGLVRWSFRPYLGRVASCFPWFLAAMLFAMAYAYGGRVYRWNQEGTFKLQMTEVKEVPEILGVDCGSVGIGVLRLRDNQLELNLGDSTFVETDSQGNRSVYPIRRLSDCLLEIVNPMNFSAVATLRIIGVAEEHFDCVMCVDEVCHLNRFQR